MSRPLAFLLLLALVGVMAIGIGSAVVGPALSGFAQLGRAL